jgi:hypothetical protein
VMDTGTAFDGTARLIRISKRHVFGGFSGDVTYAAQVGGAQSATKSSGNQVADATASGMKLCVGRFGSVHIDADVMWFALTTQDWSVALRDSLYAFAAAQFGVQLDLTERGTFLIDGDSFIRGHNTTNPHGINGTDDGTTSPPYTFQGIAPTLASYHIPSSMDKINYGRNGYGLPDAANVLPLEAIAEIDTRRTGKHLIIWSPWINSVRITYPNNGDLAAMQTAATARIAALHAAGLDIMLHTCPDFGGSWYTPAHTGTLNQQGLNADGFNNWLRSTGQFLPGVVAFADFDALDPVLLRFKINRAVTNPGIGTNACTDTAVYRPSPDSHPNEAGAALLGTLLRNAVAANPGILFPLAVPAAQTYFARLRG